VWIRPSLWAIIGPSIKAPKIINRMPAASAKMLTIASGIATLKININKPTKKA